MPLQIERRFKILTNRLGFMMNVKLSKLTTSTPLQLGSFICIEHKICCLEGGNKLYSIA